MTYFLMLLAQIEEVPLTDVLTQLMALIGGLKGASALAIAAGVVQLSMLALKSSLGKFTGKYQLLAVYGLSLGATVLSGMTVGGLSLGAALLHGNTLAAAQVLIHQVYKQFISKES